MPDLSRRDLLAALAVTPLAGGLGLQRRAPAASPIETYGPLSAALRATADKYVQALGPGGELRLEGHNGAFAAALSRTTALRGQRGQFIPADGQLVFALDVAEPIYVSGELLLLPDADLRPGLRATVHSDDTLIAAPMVAAAEWGTPTLTDAAPRLAGRRPPRGATLNEWQLTQGRHYLTVAGAHTRPGGVFQALTLQTRSRPVRAPIYTFAVIADTHVAANGPPREAMNRVMTNVAGAALRATLDALAAEDVAFSVLCGDLVEHGARDELAQVAEAVAGSGRPAYACLGSSELATSTTGQDALEVLASLLPGGAADYTFTKAPIRFIVMEPFGEDPAAQALKQQWLVSTLSADRRTPTLFVWHDPPYHRGGTSSCGFRMPDRSAVGRRLVLDALQRAPNVFATVNGSGHWDEVNFLGGVTHIQNAAFAEWPNSYRVFRVYPDRVEWEVRQVRNRGIVRESLIPAKGLSWMVATRESDLTGQVMLRRPLTDARQGKSSEEASA